MRLPVSLVVVLAGVLASSPHVAAHSLEYNGGVSPRGLLGATQDVVDREMRLQKRAGSGAACGASAGGAICDKGLCCAEGVELALVSLLPSLVER